MGIRVGILITIIGLSYSLLALNMYDIQLNQGNYYQAKAASIREQGGFLVPHRGSITITDKEGNMIPAAITKEYPLVYAVPEEIAKAEMAGTTTIEAVAEQLSELLGVDKGRLMQSLSKEKDPYEPLIKKASEEVVQVVKTGVIPGVYIEQEPSRYYPLGSMLAHAVGFVSMEKPIWEGQYGTEYFRNEQLSGMIGSEVADSVVGPINGEDIALTVDYNIQSQAERILAKLVGDFRATGGTIIVQNPKTGEILAIANSPTFDPNDYGSSSMEAFLNPAVQAVYEPGSIFKVLTVVSALDAGVITPQTMFVDTGAVVLNGETIHNWDLQSHGRVAVGVTLEKSLNTGAVFCERQLGHRAFYDYVVKFGCKEKTNIDLPGEVTGSLSPLENDPRDINFATASFGQGISITPIRLITALSAVANGGTLMEPYITQGTTPKVVRRVISEKAAREVTDMLVSAVDKAYVAHIGGYTVAGKTGTAQVPDFRKGGYGNDVINTYVGFAPAYDARFVILVKLDKPEGAPLAGLTVVPAFRDLAQFVLNYYNVPPDRVIK
ncbi:MAG: penicillin-binding protein 2 [bacterium]